MTRTAVVLFNLGGPDSLAAVKPFLFNLFNDRAIIAAPGPVRWFLARMISRRRAPAAREIYRQIGGSSPLLGLTRDQAAALEAKLNGGSEAGNGVFKTFIAMRYWHPFAAETVKAVRAWAPDRVVLLPLYPQFSTTTTASSVADWRRRAASMGLATPTRAVCCYPENTGLVAAYVELVTAGLAEARESAAGVPPPRVLFSAHGLPKKVIARGDPYQWQVERTVKAIVAGLGDKVVDWVVCYQSRVGPLEWIGPSIDEEIDRAGGDGVPVVVVPVAFVSEHSETLVELDIMYRDRAIEAGVPAYVRVPAVGVHEAFVAGLAEVVLRTLADENVDEWRADGIEHGSACAAEFGACPLGTVITR